MEKPEFAKPKTSYRKLYCYQKGIAIYDLTKLFLKDHIPTRDRTNDQMLQSARSGKANIAEGRTDAAVSLEMEIKLYGVAIGSLEEFCNMMLTLIHQNISMLRKLFDLVKEDFLKLGGIKEQMFRARIEYRDQQKGNRR